MISTALPIGYDNNQINMNTNIRFIAAHPFTATLQLRNDLEEKNKLRKQILKLRFEKEMLEQLVQCKPGSAFEAGVLKVVTDANDHIDTFMLKQSTLSDEEKNNSGMESSQRDSSASIIAS